MAVGGTSSPGDVKSNSRHTGAGMYKRHLQAIYKLVGYKLAGYTLLVALLSLGKHRIGPHGHVPWQGHPGSIPERVVLIQF